MRAPVYYLGMGAPGVQAPYGQYVSKRPKRDKLLQKRMASVKNRLLLSNLNMFKPDVFSVHLFHARTHHGTPRDCLGATFRCSHEAARGPSQFDQFGLWLRSFCHFFEFGTTQKNRKFLFGIVVCNKKNNLYQLVVRTLIASQLICCKMEDVLK